MQNSISQQVAGIPGQAAQNAVLTLFKALGDRLSSQCLTSAGLRIKGGSASAVVQAHTVVYAVAKGIAVTKALDTDMAALAGTVTNAKFNVFCHFIDSGGTLTTKMGIEGTTLGAVKFPAIVEGTAMLGMTIVNPTGTGNFVGGTTALDDATVVPNAVFINTIGAFDPSIQL